MSADFYRKVEGIIEKDPRYKADAYEFVMQALWFTQKKLKVQADVSGRQLLEGIRDFALEQYGPMARAVLAHWGIKATADFGELVFNMVDVGLMGKTDRDSRDDFKEVYDFDQAFDVFKMRSR
ncbi:MAG TPA: Minf_1886 family protein [Patescibacteria group bacterium]|nr:Minf_1886 family protein [Patescibacteria group bacterium]